MDNEPKEEEFFTPVDADLIYPNLWQGGNMSYDDIEQLKLLEIDTLVLMARGCQPGDHNFPNELEILRMPILDEDPPEPGTYDKAEQMAVWVAQRILSGRRVLVTCAAGLNRSGLVTALALRLITGKAGRECVELVQSKRRAALCNDAFASFVSMLLSCKPMEKSSDLTNYVGSPSRDAQR